MHECPLDLLFLFPSPATRSLITPLPAPLPVKHAQVSIALAVASTSIVPSSMRGKLSGLYNTAESFGRFTSAVGFAVLFAWSISPRHSSPFCWVGHRFVFCTFALGLGVVAVLAWRTLSPEIFNEQEQAARVRRAKHAGAGLDAEGGGLDIPC